MAGSKGRRSPEIDMSDAHSYYTSGLHLWRTVIMRAIQEADGEQLVVLSWQNKRGLDAEQRRELREWHTGRIQRQARAYLTTDTAFLRRVVEMAGLPETFDNFLARMRARFPKVRVN